MKKSVVKLLLVVGIGACLMLTGCTTSNNDYSAGTYKIIGSDSTNCTTVLINVQGTIKKAYIPMGVPIENIDTVIGSYAVVNSSQEAINIKKEGK